MVSTFLVPETGEGCVEPSVMYGSKYVVILVTKCLSLSLTVSKRYTSYMMNDSVSVPYFRSLKSHFL